MTQLAIDADFICASLIRFSSVPARMT